MARLAYTIFSSRAGVRPVGDEAACDGDRKGKYGAMRRRKSDIA